MNKIKLLILISAVLATKSYAQEKTLPTPQWRPIYHFSPPANWTNDPNGLIFLNG